MVNAMCILQHGSVFWSFFDEITNEWKPASFGDFNKDIGAPILPVWISSTEEKRMSFYSLVMHLYAFLNNTILGSEDLPVAYGDYRGEIKMPPYEQFVINPT